MASPFIEFQVQNGGGTDVTMTFNAYGIAIVQPIDGNQNQCTIVSGGQTFTVEGSYSAVVTALDGLFA